MDQVIPKTLRRIETYQSSLYKNGVLSRFQKMNKGHLKLEIVGDNHNYSFGLGKKIQAHIRVKNNDFFQKLLKSGDVGFGESYVEGDWESDDLVELMKWFLINNENPDKQNHLEDSLFLFLESVHKMQNFLHQDRYSSFDKNISFRYDLGETFFSQWLDESLTYSSALFQGQDLCLEEAQRLKNKRIAEQLKIQRGDNILELGCGWGSLSLYLALSYDCKVTAVTVSEEQHKYLSARVEELGLQDKIIPKLMDFRKITGRFHHIVSVELLDSLVETDLKEFFKVCNKALKRNGRMVHQVILCPESMRMENGMGEWVQKHLAPGALTPSLSQLCLAASKDTEFKLINLQDMGPDYALTFSHWREKFLLNENKLQNSGYDEKFLRTWEYFLAYAEAANMMGAMTCAQITMQRQSDLG